MKKFVWLMIAVMIALVFAGNVSADTKKDDAFLLGAEVGFINFLKDYLASGGNINAREDTYNKTLLHVAVQGPYKAVEGAHKEVVMYLLSSGAEVNARDSSLGH